MIHVDTVAADVIVYSTIDLINIHYYPWPSRGSNCSRSRRHHSRTSSSCSSATRLWVSGSQLVSFKRRWQPELLAFSFLLFDFFLLLDFFCFTTIAAAAAHPYAENHYGIAGLFVDCFQYRFGCCCSLVYCTSYSIEIWDSGPSEAHTWKGWSWKFLSNKTFPRLSKKEYHGTLSCCK